MRDRIRARTLIDLDQNDALQGSRKRQGERETGECFLEVRKSRKDVRADDDDGSGLSSPSPDLEHINCRVEQRG